MVYYIYLSQISEKCGAHHFPVSQASLMCRFAHVETSLQNSSSLVRLYSSSLPTYSHWDLNLDFDWSIINSIDKKRWGFFVHLHIYSPSHQTQPVVFLYCRKILPILFCHYSGALLCSKYWVFKVIHNFNPDLSGVTWFS